jgi:GNAT superfamily N-acetyltransferase
MRLTEAQLLQVQDMLDEFHFLAADVTQLMGACFLRNAATPTRYDGNHVRCIRLDEAVSVDAFFEEVERFYADQAFRAVRIDPWSAPASVEAGLLYDGYSVNIEIVMATDVALGGKAAEVEIRPLDGEQGWSDLQRLMEQDGGNNDGGAETFQLARRRGAAFTWYLAYAGGLPVGHFSERTRDGIGYLEDLMVLPEHRMKGIATALVHRCAASARDKGAGIVFLPAAAEDTPKLMYARMGFEPIYVFRSYVKTLP